MKIHNVGGRKYGTTNGLADLPIGNTWYSMMHRCYDPDHQTYPIYGGAGIIVCKRLKLGPQELINSIGDRPTGKTLDRIENSKSYTCGSCEECNANLWLKNVKWSTQAEQMRNRKNSRFITFLGVKYNIQDLANILECNHARVYWWFQQNWPEGKILEKIKEMGMLEKFTPLKAPGAISC